MVRAIAVVFAVAAMAASAARVRVAQVSALSVSGHAEVVMSADPAVTACVSPDVVAPACAVDPVRAMADAIVSADYAASVSNAVEAIMSGSFCEVMSNVAARVSSCASADRASAVIDAVVEAVLSASESVLRKTLEGSSAIASLRAVAESVRSAGPTERLEVPADELPFEAADPWTKLWSIGRVYKYRKSRGEDVSDLVRMARRIVEASAQSGR